jgi:hypothetical protein
MRYGGGELPSAQPRPRHRDGDGIVTGIKSAAQAQQFHAVVMRKKKLTDDLQGLRFQAPRTAQGDPDWEFLARREGVVGHGFYSSSHA